MTKKELKKILKISDQIYPALKEKKTVVHLIKGGRKKKVNIPHWAHHLVNYFEEILQAEDDFTVYHVIKWSYILGYSDKRLLTELPLSESGLYRVKSKIEDKVYQLYIVNGFVTLEEVISNKIVV